MKNIEATVLFKSKVKQEKEESKNIESNFFFSFYSKLTASTHYKSFFKFFFTENLPVKILCSSD